jgi:hypothetical protein
MIALRLTDQRMAGVLPKAGRLLAALHMAAPSSHGPRAGGRASLDWAALKPTRCRDGVLCSSPGSRAEQGIAERPRVIVSYRPPWLATDARKAGGPPG